MSGYQILGIILLVLFYGVYVARAVSLRSEKDVVLCLGRSFTGKSSRAVTAEWALLIVAALLCVMQCFSVLDNNYHLESPPLRILGIVLSFLALLFLLLPMVAMGKTWRVGIPEKTPYRLVTKGVFALSRNPVTLSFWLFYIGMFLMFANLLHMILLILCVVAFHLQILEEEKYLTAQFGNRYTEYKEKTPRYLIF